MTNTPSHDPAGWLQWCAKCQRQYWAAWRAHDASVKRMEPDRVQPHRCAQ